MKVWAYVRQHWFKFSLLVLIIFACFKKDLSFSVRLNSGKKEQSKTTNSNQTNDNKQNAVTEVTPLSIFGNLLNSGNKNTEFAAIDETTKVGFLKRFAQVAITERKKYGIPSSVILANALLQSYAGKYEGVVKANNFFRIPCTFDWSGATEKIENECIRRYDNAWLSFRDHSVFITSGKFADLRKFESDNYKAWANGLQKMGYPSHIENYSDMLIGIIEKYQLNALDKL
jgi:flagellum-specific peptidoglycan hydrolase FlgJ